MAVQKDKYTEKCEFCDGPCPSDYSGFLEEIYEIRNLTSAQIDDELKSFREIHCNPCLAAQQVKASKDTAEALSQIFSFMVAWYK